MWMYLLIAMNVVVLAMLIHSLGDSQYKPEENEYEHAVKQLFKNNSNIGTNSKNRSGQ